MLVNCLKCNQKPVIKNVYGQYTISCKCGVKQGHLFFNRNIAIDNWNKYAYKYLVAAAGNNNKDRLAVEYVIHSEVEEDAKDGLFDPQTSGGLLISLAEDKADGLLRQLRTRGQSGWVVGRVREPESFSILVCGR